MVLDTFGDGTLRPVTPFIDETKIVPALTGGGTSRYLQWRFAAIAALAFGGILIAFWLNTTRTGHADPANWFNVFYVLFARHEPLGLALVVSFAGAGILWARRGFPAIPFLIRSKPKGLVLLLTLLVCAVAALGTSLVFHQYALTADENMADFQARIFLDGKISQTVPEFWRPMIRLIIPTHATYNPATHSWMSTYLPVYAAIRAVFMSVGGQWLTNPFLAAISMLAMAGLARNLWPEERWKPILAAALLGASPQFLIMAMTSYAMPAHLAFNLIWLWLYSDPKKRRFWLAPFVGVAALGLHQPFFHALFVTPFLVRLLFARRWKASFWFALIYAIGIASWFAWWKLYFNGFSGTGSKGTFGLYPVTLVVQPMYLALLIGWLALPVPLLALLGLTKLKRQSPLLIDAAASCLLTFGFYIFVRMDQAHGWGDRYFHGALGCLILIAVVGWDELAARIGHASAATFASVGLALTLLMQLPLRCLQAEQFARPFATAADAFHSVNADIVAFDPRMAWYSADMRRNDPGMRDKPVIVSFLTMKEEDAALLQKTFPHSRLMGEKDLERLGLETKLDPQFSIRAP